MKILFFVYPWAMQSPGGGEIMLLKTKEALEKKGITVKLFNPWEDKIKDYDILHIFGSVKDCLGLMQNAKSLKVKVVLSPIYWSTLQRAMYEYGSTLKRTKMILRHMAKIVFPQISSERRIMMLLADLVVPNAYSEARQIMRHFGVSKDKIRIVPLGVDENFANATPDLFKAKYKVNEFILSVGRFEPRKNQLNLVKALKKSPKQLIFIGDPVIGYESYYNECRRQAKKDTIFISRLDHNDPLLASAYSACSVFVLQAWLETPGLAALEAGLAGARLAVTNGGSTYEYFKDYVEYFNPASIYGIRSAIEKALGREKTNSLKEHIRQHFLWSKVAQENIKVYQELMR